MIEDIRTTARADQSVLAVENQYRPFALGESWSFPRLFRPDSGSCETREADLFQRAIGAETFMLMLLRAIEIDRAHREAAVHAEEVQTKAEPRQAPSRRRRSFWLPRRRRSPVAKNAEPPMP